MFIFLFVGGESQQRHRLIKDVWDAGHLGFFALISYAYFSLASQASRSLIYKIIVTTLFCLIIGTSIEIIQTFIHREFSKDDIINDLIGGYLGLLALYIFNNQCKTKLRIIALSLFIICAAFGLRSLAIDLFDEYQMRKSFPVLADFEDRFEMSRWENHLVETETSNQYVKAGKHSLQVDFLAGQYPNISLEHLMKNWSDYKTLAFSVYNPSAKEYKFIVKVYDAKHTVSDRRYSDRFNKSVMFRPGWNHISIDMDEIRDAPKKRRMRMHQVKGFSLFTSKTNETIRLYFDHLRLEK